MEEQKFEDFENILTNLEEQKYLKQVSNGNKEAIKILAEHNLRLVAYVVKKFNYTKYRSEELISIGTIGLIKAIKTYDLNKNIELSTYASRCIENEILLFLRTNSKHRNIISLDSIIMQNEEFICDNYDFTENIESKFYYIDLRKIINDLDYRSKEIILLHYGFRNDKTYTQKEIASILNISQKTVSIELKKILLRIKEKLIYYGFEEPKQKMK